MSGYTHCACRDCFEIAIGQPGEALCHECEEHECDGGQCQVPTAYGVWEDHPSSYDLEGGVR